MRQVDVPETRTGGDDAFDAFVRLHATSLFRTAFLLSGNRYAAEDLLQDTLTQLYPQWARVAATAAPLAYVRKSLANRFISSRRVAASRELAMWELPDGWDGRDFSETVVTRRLLWQALGDLPQRQRTAIVLRYFHDLRDSDIGDVLGCREATVRSLISRGLAAMRLAPGATSRSVNDTEACS